MSYNKYMYMYMCVCVTLPWDKEDNTHSQESNFKIKSYYCTGLIWREVDMIRQY